MTSSLVPDSVEAVDYTGVLRRRWWVVLVVLVVCLVGALGYLSVAPKVYSSSAEVVVGCVPGGGNNVSGSRNTGGGTCVDLDTEAQNVSSIGLAGTVQKTLHSSQTAYQLKKSVSVSVPPNSGDMQIGCKQSTAAGAAACANAFATDYLASRAATATSYVAAQKSGLLAQINPLKKQVASLNTADNSLPPNDPTRIINETTVNADNAQLHTLDAALASLPTGKISGGRVISQALAPGKPTSPSKTLTLAGGLVVGLVLGLIFAFIADRRDKRLHSSQDVERMLSVPVLLALPRKAFSRQLVLASPRSRTGKGFTELANMMAASLGEGSHVVLVAGTTPGPAVSVVAANLAATLARTHSEAVLVCAALRDSVAAQAFGLPAGRGLAEVVAGRATVGEVARGPAGVPGLWVIPPGADTALAEYHLQHDTAKALIAQLRRDARYVIIEVQATEDGADTFALAEFADTALLTIEAGRARRDQVSDCIRRLTRMRTPLLGSVVLAPVSASTATRPAAAAAIPPGRQATSLGNGTRSTTTALPATTKTSRTRAHEEHGDPADTPAGR